MNIPRALVEGVRAWKAIQPETSSDGDPTSSRVLDWIGVNINEIKEGESLSCSAPDDQCSNQVVMLSIAITGGDQVSIGTYCFLHLELLTAFTELGIAARKELEASADETDSGEQEALTTIRGYMDSGHSLEAIREAGWGDWLDYFEAHGHGFSD